MINKYVLVRKAVLMLLIFFTGDHASDLGRLLQIRLLLGPKNLKGFFLELALTKNSLGDAP